MKIAIYLVMILPINSYANSGHTVDSKLAQNDLQKHKIDSVLNASFSYLDLVLEMKDSYQLDGSSNTDSLQREYEKERKIVDLFESLTRIKAGYYEAYVMDKELTSDLVVKWKNWCESNRKLIVWDNNKKRVNRSDLNIYDDE